MNRRRVLTVAMTVIVLVGLFLVSRVFTESLSPKENTKVLAAYHESGIIDIQELKTNSEIESTFRGSPVIIRKLEDGTYRILSLAPRFSKKGMAGCNIKRLYENSMYRENYPDGTYFIEPCRGVSYDQEGNIMEWSHNHALPMQRLQWKYVANSQNKIEIYP